MSTFLPHLKKLALLLCLMVLTASTASAAPDVETDPWSASNPFSLKSGSGKQILPKAFAQYSPSGNFLERYGFGASLTPPDPTAVDTIIISLVHASSGETELSKNIWRFFMALVFFGITLSGFITFKAISAGKEPPGLGAVKWIGKSMMAMILVTYVASSIPRTLISICDNIGNSAGSWVSADDKDVPTAMNIVSSKIMQGYQLSFFNWANEVNARISESYPEGSPQRGKLKSALQAAVQQSSQTLINTSQKLMQLSDNPGDKSTENINEEISDIAKQGQAEAVQSFRESMDAALKSVGVQDSSIAGEILQAPTLDLSGLAYPVKIIRTAIYISVIYIAISIWGFPLAVLVWAGIFSLPSQWGMSGILFSGIKGLLVVILTMVLVMTYVGGTLKAEQEKEKGFKAGITEMVSSWGSSLFGHSTKLFSMMELFSGVTTDLLIASALIISAPGQAAAIVKGANGIAESGKNAMMSGGAAYGMQQALSGMNPTGGGWSQASTSAGGGGSSMGQAGRVSLSSFQNNMNPSK